MTISSDDDRQLKQGDRVTVFNSSPSGEVFEEGIATLAKPARLGAPYWEVQFDGDREYVTRSVFIDDVIEEAK